MDDVQRKALLRMLDEAGMRISDVRANLEIVEIEPIPEAPQQPQSFDVLTIGTAKARKGETAVVPIYLTATEPISGMWLNIRHSPRIDFTGAKAKVKVRGFRVNKIHQGFRSILTFSTDLQTESSVPPEVDPKKTGVVQLDPETLIVEANYKLPDDAEVGQRFVVQASRSGGGVPGVTRISWPNIMLNWGRGISQGGGKEPHFVDGHIEVIQ